MLKQLLLPYFQKGVIYLIENIQNHKKYIGYTTQKFEQYIKGHFKDALLGDQKGKKYFYDAIREYGKENFKWRILGEVYEDFLEKLQRSLNQAEIDCIYHFRTFGKDGENYDKIYGYNMTKGGGGCLGRKDSIEVRHKKSLGHKNQIPWIKGRKQSKESNRKNSEKHKNKKFSKEHKKNLSIAAKKSLHFKNKKWMYKDLENKPIAIEEVDLYLRLGWSFGKFNNHSNKGRIWINKDNEGKMIKKEELNYYLNLGWKSGSTKRKAK